MSDPRNTLHWLRRLDSGDSQASSELQELVYQELRRIAGWMTPDSRDRTISPTVMVHEAYLKLVGSENSFENRGHFVAVATRAMRQVLADYVKSKRTAKRGDDWGRVTLSGASDVADRASLDLLDLEEALEELEKVDERYARIVELRFLGGLPVEEVAKALGVNERTVRADWRAARAWLRARLDRDSS